MNRQRDRRLRIGLVVVAVLVVLGVGAFFGWQAIGDDSTEASETSGSSDTSDTGDTDDTGGGGAGGAAESGCPTDGLPDDVPEGVTCGFESSAAPGMGSGIGTGEQDAPVVVEMYEDFMCPHCANFEAQTAQALAGYVESGDVRVVRYPMTLTPFGEPTELAANAYACAADAGRADEYAAGLFERAGTIWSTDTLFQVGAVTGLSSDADFVACVNEGGFEAWLTSIDDAAMQRGVAATPTVFVNGEEVALSTTPLAELEAAIEAALGGN